MPQSSRPRPISTDGAAARAAEFDRHCPELYRRVADTVAAATAVATDLEGTVGLGARRVALVSSFCPQRALSGSPDVAASWTCALLHVLHVAMTHAAGVAVLDVPLRPGCVKDDPQSRGCQPTTLADHAFSELLYGHCLFPLLGACRVRALSSAGGQRSASDLMPVPQSSRPRHLDR